MTKLKSKKMTKSTFAVIIMAIAMVAMLAFGGTYAYFTATAGAGLEGTVHTAEVKLTTAADSVTFTGHAAEFLPSETLSATVTYSDASTRGTWVFFKLSDEMPDVFTISGIKVGSENATETSNGSGIYYYENSQTDAANGDKVKSASLVVSFTIEFAASADDTYQNKTYTITLEACSVQHEGLATATLALAQSAFKAKS